MLANVIRKHLNSVLHSSFTYFYSLDHWTEVHLVRPPLGIYLMPVETGKTSTNQGINIASVFGIKVFAPGGTVYCATKSAVRTLTEGLRREVHADKIRTTIISPGAVDSELKESKFA